MYSSCSFQQTAVPVNMQPGHLASSSTAHIRLALSKLSKIRDKPSKRYSHCFRFGRSGSDLTCTGHAPSLHICWLKLRRLEACCSRPSSRQLKVAWRRAQLSLLAEGWGTGYNSDEGNLERPQQPTVVISLARRLKTCLTSEMCTQHVQNPAYGVEAWDMGSHLP